MAKNGDPPKKPLESESDVDGEEDKDEASSEEVVSSDPEAKPTETENSRKEKGSSTQAALKKSQPHPSSKPQQQSFSSSSSEESGSESDTESDGSDSNIKPLASKLMDDSQKSDNGARKPRSNPNHLEPASPVKSVGTKRPAEVKVEDKDVKKSKKRPVTEPENKKSGAIKDDVKKQIFQRLWSEEDEIIVLKGMIDYEDLNNAEPVADLNAFHDFIKKNLHVDVTRAQLQDKIRRLKKKYVNNRNKEIEGKDMTFVRPHEQTAYEWSKKVWLKENGKKKRAERGCESPNLKGSAVRKSSSKRAKMVEIGEAKEVRRVEVLSAAERPRPNGVSIEERILMEREKRVEWKKLKLVEMELYLKKLDLLIAQTKLILDASKSTYH